FAESLGLLLTGLERGEVAAADGSPFFRFRPVPLVPRPVSRHRPPVVVAATTPATAEAAAVRGLPLLLGLHADDDERCRLLAGSTVQALPFLVLGVLVSGVIAALVPAGSGRALVPVLRLQHRMTCVVGSRRSLVPRGDGQTENSRDPNERQRVGPAGVCPVTL